jgi:hypothetical protein
VGALGFLASAIAGTAVVSAGAGAAGASDLGCSGGAGCSLALHPAKTNAAASNPTDHIETRFFTVILILRL